MFTWLIKKFPIISNVQTFEAVFLRKNAVSIWPLGAHLKS